MGYWETDFVCHRSLTGHPSRVRSRLCRKIGALARHGGFHRKIGITNKPARRWREYYGPNGWHEMHVLYVSRSHSHVCSLERELVRRFDEELMRSPGYPWNGVGGGGGRRPSYGPYYLYMVRARKYARIWE